MFENEVEWVGEFTDEERGEINRLRESQVEAIKKNDARSYRNLCTEDIVLMLTGFDIIRGREKFYETEKKFLEKIKVKVMEQLPAFIERFGDKAIEVGRQKFETFPDSFSPEGFSAIRKYMHVLKKDTNGWKFSYLMSNDCEIEGRGK